MNQNLNSLPLELNIKDNMPVEMQLKRIKIDLKLSDSSIPISCSDIMGPASSFSFTFIMQTPVFLSFDRMAL